MCAMYTKTSFFSGTIIYYNTVRNILLWYQICAHSTLPSWEGPHPVGGEGCPHPFSCFPGVGNARMLVAFIDHHSIAHANPFGLSMLTRRRIVGHSYIIRTRFRIRRVDE